VGGVDYRGGSTWEGGRGRGNLYLSLNLTVRLKLLFKSLKMCTYPGHGIKELVWELGTDPENKQRDWGGAEGNRLSEFLF
jgi:hypothetical protein